MTTEIPLKLAIKSGDAETFRFVHQKYQEEFGVNYSKYLLFPHNNALDVATKVENNDILEVFDQNELEFMLTNENSMG